MKSVIGTSTFLSLTVYNSIKERILLLEEKGELDSCFGFDFDDENLTIEYYIIHE